MKTSIDCIPCFVRQTIDAVRYVSDDPHIHESVLREILRSLTGIDLGQSPPVTGQLIHRRIRELTGNSDPYKETKDRFNHFVAGLLPELKTRVISSQDPLETSVRLAIMGNVIDFGPKNSITENDIRLSITEALSGAFNFDIESLRSSIDKAAKILYLADNAGEIFFDRLLIEELPLDRLVLAVRGGPVINDATLDDAYTAGLHKIVRIIDNGSDAPGTILSDCSSEFRKCFKEADLIISKGQGNYESLNDVQANIFFLFRIKCSLVALHTGIETGTNVLIGTKK